MNEGLAIMEDGSFTVISSRGLRVTLALRLCVYLSFAIGSFTALANRARADVTADQVNSAIKNGVAFLEKRQRPNGSWGEIMANEPGGVTALCTLALLNSGRTAEDESVKKALAYLEKSPEPNRIYSVAVSLLMFAQANPRKYAIQIRQRANWIETRQLRTEGKQKGGWRYTSEDVSADNSATQFAILALHEAERAGVKVSDQTWQLALNYWNQPGMQASSGAYGYQADHSELRGSMTCAGIASLIILRDRLQAGSARVIDGNVQCCGNEPEQSSLDKAMDWMGQNFSVQRNPNDSLWWLYYLYALERVGRLSGQRFFTTRKPGGTIEMHDWYREGCEVLVDKQDKFDFSWTGNGQGENNEIGTSFALLFLSKGRRPVVIAKLQHHAGMGLGSADWDHHRRAVQNLTNRVEKKWQRDLSWQTVDFTRRGPRQQLQVTAADLKESPVLFLSGSQPLDLNDEQKQVLKQYLENGGFLFAEACNGNGCNGVAFDRSFRQLMQDIFPDSELRKLPPDHAVWYAQEKVDPNLMPKDPDFWLWGLDACCRTSVVYCPRSLSCYWELAHPYRESDYPKAVKDEIEQVSRIGSNVLAYATGRELKEKLDRPQIVTARPGALSPRGALVVPKLGHGGGADDAPAALNNLLIDMQKREIVQKVDTQKRVIPPGNPQLFEYPIMFMHGRRAFRFTAAERKAIHDYLSGERGGFIFADAICANKEFADSLRAELKTIYPGATFTRIPPDHDMFTQDFHGYSLKSVELRDPQIRGENDPLTTRLVKTTPLLEGLEIDGRIAVVLSPYDLSCALEQGASLECKGYTPEDARRIGANVLLYALLGQ